MDIQALEVYASDSNYAVIKPPGRNFPGCVIQGDSLGSLTRMAKNIADYVAKAGIEDDDLLENVQELANLLVGRMLHYQSVLTSHGISFPHVHPFTDGDLVSLLPDDEDD